MNEKDIMKGNIKLVVFDTFDFKELKKISTAIENLGYESKIVSNGNVVFQKIKVEEVSDNHVFNPNKKELL